MSFSVIENTEQLDEALAFLADRFDWRETMRTRIRNSLIRFNGDFSYGAVLRNRDGELVIAILFFYQGLLSTGVGTRPVVNLSSWYAVESYRGIEAVLFANRVVTHLRARSCITTNYTPTDAAKSVLLALGFRFQSAASLRLYAWSRRIPGGNGLTDIGIARDPLECVSGFTCSGNLVTRRFNLKGRDLDVAFSVIRVKKFGVLLRLVRIYWAKDYDLLIGNITSICFRLLLEQKAVAADIYLHSAVPQPQSPWLIDDASSAVSFIPPLQSELACI